MGLDLPYGQKGRDILTQDFESDESIKVLHIKRGNLWQIDPVADLDSGDLYVLMSRKNLKERIKGSKSKNNFHHIIYIRYLLKIVI